MFHRVDDVGRRDRAVSTLLDALARLGVRRIAAVIPGQLSREWSGVLRDPGLEVFQHGVHHVSRTGRGYPDEFPSWVPTARVRAELEWGCQRIEDRIGREVRGYVPPWNSTSKQTTDILEVTGFTHYSAHSRFPQQTRLIPVHVSYDTVSSYLPLTLACTSRLRAQIAAAKDCAAGVMYHVNGLGDAEVKRLITILESIFS